MFNRLRNKNKENKDQKSSEGFETATQAQKRQSDLFREPEYQEIKAMPDKFLKGSSVKRKNKTPLIIGIIVVLIIIVLTFSGLLLFSDGFNELLFGKVEILEETPTIFEKKYWLTILKIEVFWTKVKKIIVREILVISFIILIGAVVVIAPNKITITNKMLVAHRASFC